MQLLTTCQQYFQKVDQGMTYSAHFIDRIIEVLVKGNSCKAQMGTILYPSLSMNPCCGFIVGSEPSLSPPPPPCGAVYVTPFGH